MLSENLNLKTSWITFSDHLRKTLHDLKNSNEFTDVTLVCDDKRHIKAHKVILSAYSSVFKSILKDLPQTNSAIFLSGVNHQVMESILEFVYLGETTFDQSRMNEFLSVSTNLKIKNIVEDLETSDKIRTSDSEKNFNYLKDTDIVNLQTPNSKIEISENHFMDETFRESLENSEMNPQIENQCISKNEDYAPEISNDEKVTKLKSEPFPKTSLENSEFILVIEDQCIAKKEEILFHCNQCERKFKWKKNLSVHIQTQHEGIKFPCVQCDKQFSHQTSLLKHFKSKHQGIAYSCKQCVYVASECSNLKRHIQSQH